eukprot:2580456-Rhodomonas_salina.1
MGPELARYTGTPGARTHPGCPGSTRVPGYPGTRVPGTRVPGYTVGEGIPKVFTHASFGKPNLDSQMESGLNYFCPK